MHPPCHVLPPQAPGEASGSLGRHTGPKTVPERGRARPPGPRAVKKHGDQGPYWPGLTRQAKEGQGMAQRPRAASPPLETSPAAEGNLGDG